VLSQSFSALLVFEKLVLGAFGSRAAVVADKFAGTAGLPCEKNTFDVTSGVDTISQVAKFCVILSSA